MSGKRKQRTTEKKQARRLKRVRKARAKRERERNDPRKDFAPIPD